jgi:hypothetical protein
MEAPKVRPKNLKKDFDESALRAEELSKKNKSTSEEFGNLELRSDLDEHISWNALSRLGYDPDRMQLLDAGKGYREATAQAAYAPSRMTKKDLQSSFINFDNYEDLNPDDVIVTPNVSVPRVIAHEFTHRGIDLIRELYNEDPKFFKNVYGKDAANIIETIDEEGVEEELVELFDDPSDDYKKDLYGKYIPTTGAYGTVTDSTDEIDKNLYLDIDRPYVQNKLKGSSAKDLGYFTKARMQRMIPGHVGILQAAEDLLEKQGEPPIARQKNFLQKTMGFAIGGLATEEAPRSNSMSRQMEMALASGSNDVDPVSGNEVPPGSLPEEVRDDIDARLSEGEYVVPADVVRYFGVAFLEDLRMKAKIGLAKMDADGRIGGEPVDDESMPMDMASAKPEGISDEDIASLEQALTTGVFEGGLMDKVALVAKNDSMVNSRMKAKGFAVGGLTGEPKDSQYSDPTKIDSLIDKFMVSAQQNPALMQELAQRGVTINKTSANQTPQEMQASNTGIKSQTERVFNEGGSTSEPLGFSTTSNPQKTSTGFDFGNYGLGFSAFGSPESGGSVNPVVPVMMDYYNPATGATMQIAHDPSSNQPQSDVPDGFVLGLPPASTVKVDRDGRDERQQDYEQDKMVDHMKDYDYKTPDGLFESSQARMKEGVRDYKPSGIGKLDKFGSLTNDWNERHNIRTEILANIQILEGIEGFPEKQINVLKAQVENLSKNMSPTSIGWSNMSVKGVVERTNKEIAKNGNQYGITPEVNAYGFEKFEPFGGIKSYVDTVTTNPVSSDNDSKTTGQYSEGKRFNPKSVKESVDYSGSGYERESGVREDRGVSGGTSGVGREEQGGGDRGMYKGGLMKKKKKKTKK